MDPSLSLFPWMRGMATLRKTMIGVCQLTSTADKEKNFEDCRALVREGAERGARVFFLPEAFDYVGSNQEETLGLAETLGGDLIQRYMNLARNKCTSMPFPKMFSLFQEVLTHSATEENFPRIYNAYVLINDSGKIAAVYQKTHLFDAEMKGRISMKESNLTIHGPGIETPVDTPIGKLGLAICYDLRFPEISLTLAQAGAEILTFPSAFTMTTGLAHWEALLRARAIETQSYVVAAAQTGRHNDVRTSYGHSMVVDPWGCVIAQCHEGLGICYAEIDLQYLRDIRRDRPVMQHRRTDLYGTVRLSPSHCVHH